MTIEELIEEFDDLGDWADQCEVLLDLGRDLPEMDSALKTDDTKVHGCQSNVWMVANVSETEPQRIELVADSDAMIVKGLLRRSFRNWGFRYFGSFYLRCFFAHGFPFR